MSEVVTGRANRGWWARLWRYHLDRSTLYNLFRRATHKPTSWDRMVADAELPGVVEGALDRILRRVRVLPFEKLAFTAEMLGHCRDGLDAGTPPDDLARGLGEPRRAGRLVTRAIRRKRPPIVRAALGSVRVAKRGVLTLVVVYAVLFVWFIARRPEVTTDHFAEMTARVTAVPPEDRAAPLVAEQMETLHAMQEERAGAMGYEEREHDGETYVPLPPNWLGEFPSLHRDEPEFAEVIGLLEASDPLIQELWVATARPHLGADLIRGSSPGRLGQLLIGTLLPHLGTTRKAARLLALDATVYAERGDAERVTRDLEAMARLGFLLHTGDSVIITRLVGNAVIALASEHTLRILAEYPDLLDDEQLASLGAAFDHRIAFDLEDEVRMHADFVQRAYAPGPNGRITAEGMLLISEWNNYGNNRTWASVSETRQLLLGPLAALFFVDRGTSEKHRREMAAELEAAAAMTVIPDATWEELDRIDDPPELAKLRDPITEFLRTANARILSGFQQTRARRDATIVALAAHRYRLDHGSFPKTACELVPSYLDAVPVDRFDGQPMRLKSADGELVIYLTGNDRDDDGGRAAEPESPRDDEPVWQLEPTPKHRRVDGDWVVFPPLADEYAPIRAYLRR